jgi:putative FmdB family regulatory protein
MPTYQYRCTECGHDLEAVQKFSDAALTECPSCGGQLRKVYNAVGVVFKGSGFYRTDSRKAPSEKSSSEAASGTNGKEPGDKSAPAKEKGSDSGSKTPAKASSTSASSTASSGSSTGSKAASS